MQKGLNNHEWAFALKWQYEKKEEEGRRDTSEWQKYAFKRLTKQQSLAYRNGSAEWTLLYNGKGCDVRFVLVVEGKERISEKREDFR